MATNSAAIAPAQRARRFTAQRAAGLPRLDGRELPGLLTTHRSHKRPELLDVLGNTSRALHEPTGGIVDDEVQHGCRHVDGHVVSPALLPRLTDLGPCDLDLLESVALPCPLQPVALCLKDRVHLGGHPIPQSTHATRSDSLLNLDERVASHDSNGILI